MGKRGILSQNVDGKIYANWVDKTDLPLVWAAERFDGVDVCVCAAERHARD